jgi:hypothetical protein
VLADRDRFGSACCDPSMTWDRHGNVFLSFLAYEGSASAPTVIVVLWSQDAGDSWSVFDRIQPGPTSRTRAAAPLRAREPLETRGQGADQPTITSGRGGLWAIWFHDGSLEVAGARVRGLGDAGAFGAVRRVPGTKNCTFGDIAVGPLGEVAQVCQRNVAGSTPRRSVLRFNVDRDGFGPKDFTKSEVLAHTNVSLFESIRPQHYRTVDAEAGLAWDTSHGPHRGRLSLLFTDERPDQSDDTDLWLLHSDNVGRTWSARTRIVQAPNSQFLPRIALDRTNGHLAVSYHTAELDEGLGGLFDTDGKVNSDAGYAIVFSADGGDTWGVPTMLSEAGSNADAAANEVDFGDYSGLAFVAGIAHPAWADNSNSTGDNPNGTLHRFDIYSIAFAEV